jgi:16S rRNA processing protein RimM
MSSVSASWVRIGKIVGFHGLKGVVKLRPTATPPDWLGMLKSVHLHHAPTKTWKTLHITKATDKDPLVWLQFEGYPDLTSVEPLKGFEAWADKDDLPQPDGQDDFWADDLVGLTVVDHATGNPVGQVLDLLSSTGQDYLEIALDDPLANQDTSDADPEQVPGLIITVPFLAHFFPVVDTEQGVVHLCHLDGWLDNVTHRSS